MIVRLIRSDGGTVADVDGSVLAEHLAAGAICYHAAPPGIAAEDWEATERERLIRAWRDPRWRGLSYLAALEAARADERARAELAARERRLALPPVVLPVASTPAGAPPIGGQDRTSLGTVDDQDRHRLVRGPVPQSPTAPLPLAPPARGEIFPTSRPARAVPLLVGAVVGAGIAAAIAAALT